MEEQKEKKTNYSQLKVLESIAPAVKQNLSLLKSVEESWQPSDFLPNLESEKNQDYHPELDEFRKKAKTLDDSILVVLTGNMVTEEALPSYSTKLNTIARDETGISQDPWALWLRGWTAEENRHGDLLNAYMRLSGRVAMKAVEKTIQHLLREGFSYKYSVDFYAGLVYTSFQEAATKISHQKTGRLAGLQGDNNLSRICMNIAMDEGRHEAFYTEIMAEVFKADPSGAVIAFRSMMQEGIDMPAKRMTDGRDINLFGHYSAVAQRIGVYTARDYVELTQHFLNRWKVPYLKVQDDAAKARDELCRLPAVYERIAERLEKKLPALPRVKFSWIHDREA